MSSSSRELALCVTLRRLCLGMMRRPLPRAPRPQDIVVTVARITVCWSYEHDLSKATCLIQPRLLCVFHRVEDRHDWRHYSPPLKRACVRQVVLVPVLDSCCVFKTAAAWALPSVGAKYYTPELAQMNIHWKMPLKIHRRFPVTIHWKSDNPLGHTTDK